jgi:hypothetical protein
MKLKLILKRKRNKMNHILSTNEPRLVNGKNMKPSDFGVVTAIEQGHGDIRIGDCVFKSYDILVNLRSGWGTTYPEHYTVTLKDTVTLQREK